MVTQDEQLTWDFCSALLGLPETQNPRRPNDLVQALGTACDGVQNLCSYEASRVMVVMVVILLMEEIRRSPVDMENIPLFIGF